MQNKVLNKEFIKNIKNDDNYLFDFFKNQNERSILYLLENLGRFENGYSKYPLLYLLNHKNENIRALSLKNLAKLSDLELLNFFVEFAKNDSSTIVRREAVSAIGRLRNQIIIPHLVRLLSDEDSKVIMQAIRGLLKFSNNDIVKDKLMGLLNHPNEVIKEIIQKE